MLGVSPALVGQTIICADCGAQAARRGNTQRYCPSCSGRRDTDRKAKWAVAHGSKPYDPEKARRQESAVVAAGAERSTANAASFTWPADTDPDLHSIIRVAIPFDYAGSKNGTWRTGRGGHVYAKAEGRLVRNSLALMLKNAARGHRWYAGKVWIDIFVEKPNHRGDATNFVDMICDAVKDAIGVDDRWYALRRLDWAIVKKDPRIIVGVGQEISEDHQVCSHCGRQLPLAEFGRNRNAANGRSRRCIDCGSPKRGRSSLRKA